MARDGFSGRAQGRHSTAKHMEDMTPSVAAERLLLTHEKTPGFLASGGEEFNPGPKVRQDRSEL